MILFLIYQGLAFFVGRGLLYRAQITLLDKSGTWGLSYLLGVLVLGVLSYVVDIWLTPQQTYWITLAISGLTVISLHGSREKLHWPSFLSKDHLLEKSAVILTTTGILLFLGRLASKVVFYGEQKNILVSPSTNFGDITVHLHLINFFLTNPPLIVPEAPYFSGTPMRYPFMVDYLIAVGNPWGDIVSLLQLQSFLLLICAFISLRSLTLQLFAPSDASKKLWWAAILAPLLVLSFEPGLEHWLIHRGPLWTERLPQIEVLSLFFGHLLPQRGLLFGFSAALLTFCATHRWCWSSTASGMTRKQLLLLSLMSALVFLAHPFCWAWIALLSLPYLLPLTKPKIITSVLTGCFTAVLGIVMYPTLFGFFGHFFESTLKWHPLWLAPKTWIGVPEFWLFNLGTLGLLLLCLGFRIHRQLAISGLIAFFLTNGFQFLPWIWDNTKILTLTLICLGVLYTGWILKQINLNKTAVAILLVLLWFLNYNRGLWRWVDLARSTPHEVVSTHLIQEASQLLPQEDRMLVYPPTHQHPCILTGCLSYLTFPGHVFSYGLKEWTTREAEAKKILKETNEKWLWISRDQLSEHHIRLRSAWPQRPAQ